MPKVAQMKTVSSPELFVVTEQQFYRVFHGSRHILIQACNETGHNGNLTDDAKTLRKAVNVQFLLE